MTSTDSPAAVPRLPRRFSGLAALSLSLALAGCIPKPSVPPAEPPAPAQQPLEPVPPPPPPPANALEWEMLRMGDRVHAIE